MNPENKEILNTNQKSFIEHMLDARGITDKKEREKEIKEHEEGVKRIQEHMEERFIFLRPFIKKLQIFTQNDIYQYIKKEKENPNWVKFSSVNLYLQQLFKNGELKFHVIHQEDPRPNTVIFYLPNISEEIKQTYIDCVKECNKLKTDCHEKLFQKNS